MALTLLAHFCACEGVVVVKSSYLFSFTCGVSIFVLPPRLERTHKGRVYLKTQKKHACPCPQSLLLTPPLTQRGGGALFSQHLLLFWFSSQSETVKSCFVSSSELSTYWIMTYYRGEEHFLHIKHGLNCFPCPRMTRIGYFLHAARARLAVSSTDGQKSRKTWNIIGKNVPRLNQKPSTRTDQTLISWKVYRHLVDGDAAPRSLQAKTSCISFVRTV